MKNPTILILVALLFTSGCGSTRTFSYLSANKESEIKLHLEYKNKNNEDIFVEGTANNIKISKLVTLIESNSDLTFVLSDEISENNLISFEGVKTKTWIEFLEEVLPQNGMQFEFISEDRIRVKRTEEIVLTSRPIQFRQTLASFTTTRPEKALT